MQTHIHETIKRPWGLETLVTVIDDLEQQHNFEISGDFSVKQISTIAEQKVTERLRHIAEFADNTSLSEKDLLISEIAVLKTEKAALIIETAALKVQKEELIAEVVK